ncbi:30S ribosomal protein S8 [Candidatus Daviesbacteria bacterium]|nr:30S ribosomal protein S8 [Candidatus Daviesbacteria bacterium]
MDIVADSLIRIKNGYLAYREEVILPYSKLVLAICKLLANESFIESFKEEKVEGKNYSSIKVVLKYLGKKPALTDIKRISKPGLRIYKSRKALPKVLNGFGLAIISTPKGVMSDKEARKNGLGGEVMAHVW